MNTSSNSSLDVNALKLGITCQPLLLNPINTETDILTKTGNIWVFISIFILKISKYI